MAAWYIFNTLGFYPVNPASTEYIVGSPIFDRVDIRFPAFNGRSEHTTTILAKDARNKPYVANLLMDSDPVVKPVLKHVDVMSMSVLEFSMSDQPQTWGAGVM